MSARVRQLRRNARKEASVIALCFLLLFIIFISLDAFEFLARLAVAHESWQLDELLTALVLLPIGLVIFAMRRLRETTVELRRRVIAERRASVLARFDRLTGLPTRRSALAAIRRNRQGAKEHPFVVLVIDFKRFRSINSLHGSRIGDQVIVALAERLKGLADPGDFVARLAGDEFLMLLLESGEEEQLPARVAHIAAQIEVPVYVGEDKKGIVVGASIGVALVDDGAVASDQIIAQAFSALERAKTSGATSFAFFAEGMDSKEQDRAQLEADLRDAIAEGEIVPFFQPVVDLRTGKVVGYEALARWLRPDGTWRDPDQFITVAEYTGQIEELFYSMLEQAACVAATWPAELYLAVNLSPLQFGSPWLVENTLRILAKAGLPAGRLEIEITESALTTDFVSAGRTIAEFRKQRIRVSLDDFGTGYSSLQHLTELQFDKIKIDRSFVRDLESNAGQRTIILAIVTMAHALDLQVTVEGIDCAEYAETVARYGCDQGQGYLFGRPEPAVHLDSSVLGAFGGICFSEEERDVSSPDERKARALP